MAGPDDIIEMPALGRPFQLGMLYDCCKDALLSEHSLLDPEVHRSNSPKTIPLSNVIEEISANTIGEKAAALKIKPSLLTSLLCGLFEVSGSAKYLLSPKRSGRQVCTSYKYLATESIEREWLPLGASEPEVFLGAPHIFTAIRLGASHIVTAIRYGAQAFLEYDTEVPSSETSTAAVSGPGGKMPVIRAQGKSAHRGDHEEKSQNQMLNCRFYGDFSLDNDLVTFQDPMEIHPSLPKLLGEHGEKAVPINVRLYPLKKLGFKTLNSFHEISDALNYDIKDEMEGLLEVETKCNDLLNRLAAKTFPEIREKIQRFIDLCDRHKQAFQKQLAEVVPSIREGNKEEKELEEVLKWKKLSLFSTQRLREFLAKKEQEISFVNSFLTSLKEAGAICLKHELSEKFFHPGTDFVVTFMFTSLHEEEQYFSKLKASLSSLKQRNDSNGERESTTEWYEDTAILKRARDTATSFSAFANANLSRKKTQFAVASIQDQRNPGASIYLYDSGNLKETKFEPPTKPLPIKIEEISHDSVQLSFTPALCGNDVISCYQFEYRVMEQESWVPGVTNGREETVTIRGLCPDTEYQFRYAAVTKPGLSEYSDLSLAVRTLPACPPPAPEEMNAGATGELPGNQSLGNSQGIHPSFRSEERITDCTKKVMPMGDSRKNTGHQQGLVREMESAGNPPSFPPKPFTEETATHVPSLKGDSKKITSALCQPSRIIRKGPPSVYFLPLERSCNDPKSACLRYRFGWEEGPQVSPKVIMLLGETGSGKSTLLNGMINYILGVQWEDDFRFSVIQEDLERSRAQSQTDTLTAYEIPLNRGLQVPYPLTIIDTPGFGDTRGMKHDRMILEQIRELFLIQDGIDHIDAVCIVVRASQARLTPSQSYCFNSVLSIFGKDIRNSIQILITFADGKTPPVLEAVSASDVPCAKDAKGVPVHFQFNNSALFASNIKVAEDNYNFNQMFWVMGRRSMEMFFRSLNDLAPQGLALSAEVLTLRKELEAVVQGIQPQIQMALVKMGALKKTRIALEKHQVDMRANRDFEYEVETIMPVKTSIRGTECSTTNCLNCQFTCHYPCQVQNNAEKWNCAAVDKHSKHCNVCPGKCPWNVHRSESYVWEYSIVREKQSYAQLKERFKAAHGKKVTAQHASEWLLKELKEVEKHFIELLKKLSHYLQKLKNDALKPSAMDLSDYIDLLINSEEKDLQPGYEERINILKDIQGRISSNPSTRRQ